jgi:Family of unknown function (DUF6069)
MSTTTTHPSLGSPIEAATEGTRPTGVGRTGLVGGLTASVATFAVAVIAHGAGVPLKVSGSAIPLAGFAEVTFVAAMIGTLLAVGFIRRAARPRRAFLVTTIALTALSFVPDLTAHAHTATKFTLLLTHVVAAAIVIPALASRLSD